MWAYDFSVKKSFLDPLSIQNKVILLLICIKTLTLLMFWKTISLNVKQETRETRFCGWRRRNREAKKISVEKPLIICDLSLLKILMILFEMGKPMTKLIFCVFSAKLLLWKFGSFWSYLWDAFCKILIIFLFLLLAGCNTDWTFAAWFLRVHCKFDFSKILKLSRFDDREQFERLDCTNLVCEHFAFLNRVFLPNL